MNLAQAHPKQGSYGLGREVLSPMETLAQSVSTIAPTTTPVATIPLVCALGRKSPGRDTTPGLPALNAACFTIPLLAPDALGGAIPSNDPYETNFTTGQRNIFRQAWQRRMDVSFVKSTSVAERMSRKFRFDVFNITNPPSFDVPIDNVTQNQYYRGFPAVGTPALPTACGGSNTGCYNCPYGLGNVNKTIGSARQIQFSVHLVF